MSDQDTPQHDDEATARDVMAEALRIDADDPVDSWSRKVWPHRADVAIAALKEAGFEITKRPATIHHSPDSWQHIVGGPYAGQEAGKAIAGALEPLSPGAQLAATTGFELARRAAAQAEADLAAKRDDMTLAAALDVIGRRTDIVAVKLREPTSTPTGDGYEGCLGEWNPLEEAYLAAWDDIDPPITAEFFVGDLTIDEARKLGAALFAVAARADAARVDAAEGEAK